MVSNETNGLFTFWKTTQTQFETKWQNEVNFTGYNEIAKVEDYLVKDGVGSIR